MFMFITDVWCSLFWWWGCRSSEIWWCVVGWGVPRVAKNITGLLKQNPQHYRTTNLWNVNNHSP